MTKWSKPLFALLIATSVVLWWHALRSTFALALSDERYTQILLIVPIGIGLILLDWKPVQEPSISETINASGMIVGFLAMAVLTNIVLKATTIWPGDIQLAASMLALVAFWIASFALSFGRVAFWHARFPLFFLLWIIPWPDFVLNRVVGALQWGSAAAAHLLFLAVGIPVEQRGMLIRIPGLIMEVAPECSSIRSSLMLLVTTMVLAHLLLRSPWKKLLVVAAAIPLSVAKNGLRIFVLGILATRVDPNYMTGNLHREGGIIYFTIALAAIFALLVVLRRREGKENRVVRVTES